MNNHSHAFFQLAIQQQALRFGEYTLKSGRISPYFFNAGLFNDGSSLGQLAKLYAHTIAESGVEYDVLFGPAYKGIPLVAATSVALSELTGKNVPWCFNRKEAKDHGEGGTLVGSELQGNVIIIDDVITAGTAIREAMGLISAQGANLAGIAIALDRQERGQGEKSAIQELQEAHDVSVMPIATLSDLMGYLEAHAPSPEVFEQVKQYRDTYGV